MPSVVVPAEFFRKERNTVYSNWPIAFWRELIQNAVDADSTLIQVETKTIAGDANSCVVTFGDNGSGMTREVLDSVYFQLGRSSKDNGAIGGFGRARILTCFAQNWYKIWSFNYEVEGRGASYEVVDNSRSVSGVTLEIGVDMNEANMAYHLTGYVKNCSFECEITLNGKGLEKSQDKLERIKTLDASDKPWATIYKVKSGYTGVYVRVNGAVMFTRFHDELRVFVDVHTDCSREVLAASRDTFKEPYESVFNAFVRSLDTHRRRALKPPFQKTQGVTRGSGSIITLREEQVHEEEDGSERTRLMVADDLAAKVATPEFVRRIMMEAQEEGKEANITPLPSIMYLVDEPQYEAVAKSWSPAAWRFKVDGHQIRWVEGQTKVRLLLAWLECCSHAVKALLDAAKLNRLEWSIGWYFGEEEAVHLEERGVHYFLVRPTSEKSANSRFSTRERSDMKHLMALAKHEVAHALRGIHDEAYANLLTDLDSKYQDWQVLQRLMSIRV